MLQTLPLILLPFFVSFPFFTRPPSPSVRPRRLLVFLFSYFTHYQTLNSSIIKHSTRLLSNTQLVYYQTLNSSIIKHSTRPLSNTRLVYYQTLNSSIISFPFPGQAAVAEREAAQVAKKEEYARLLADKMDALEKEGLGNKTSR
jgi:hypothetical protein